MKSADSVLTDKVTLASLLRSLQEKDGRSIEPIAAAVGVHPSAVRRWLAGSHLPSIDNLSALLTALNADNEDRAEALYRLRDPTSSAAIQQVLAGRDSDGATCAENNDWRQWMPATGDLLRAMRQRRGLSGADLARAIGVTSSTITRWEKTELPVDEQYRERLFSVLCALPEEQVALANEAPLLAQPWRDESASFETWDQRIETLGARLQQGGNIPGDLYLLVLETHLWEAATRNPTMRGLLARAYTWHADWAGQKGRPIERGMYAGRALSLLSPRSSLDYRGSWASARMLRASYLTTIGRRRQSIRVLEQTLTYFPGTEHRLVRSELLREMAGTGQPLLPRQAFVWVEDSERLAEEAGAADYLRGSREVKAILYLANQKLEAALPYLPETADDPGLQDISIRLLWARAMLQAEDRNAAHDHLNRFFELVKQYDYPHMIPEGEALARNL